MSILTADADTAQCTLIHHDLDQQQVGRWPVMMLYLTIEKAGSHLKKTFSKLGPRIQAMELDI